VAAAANTERVAEAAQFGSCRGLIDDGRPIRHQDGRITRRGQVDEPSERVQSPVGVARAGPGSLRLGTLHDTAHSRLPKSEHLRRCLDHDTQLVMILPARQSSAVRGRADLDQQDRRIG
jgi:hypothetical protein